MSKILMVCGMVNTKNAFDVARLQLHGHEVEVIQGTKVEPGILETAMNDVDALFCGMASPSDHAALELRVLEIAQDKKIPFGFLSDADGAFARDTFGAYRATASFVGVRTPRDVEGAKKFFPNAKVECVWHPTLEDAAQRSKQSREEVRKKLGLTDNDVAVCFTGGKAPKFNKATLGVGEEAVHHESNFRLLFLPHPGATGEGPRKAGKEILLGDYKVIAPHATIVMDEKLAAQIPADQIPPGTIIGAGLKSTDVTPAVDVYVYAGGTGAESAIYNSVPLILFNSPEVVAMRDMDATFLATSGSAFVATDRSSLLSAIALAASSQGRDLLAANWEFNYLRPAMRPPAPGTSASLMAKLVASFALEPQVA